MIAIPPADVCSSLQLGVLVGVGCVHDVLQAATREASAVNHGQNLSGIRVGLEAGAARKALVGHLMDLACNLFE